MSMCGIVWTISRTNTHIEATRDPRSVFGAGLTVRRQCPPATDHDTWHHTTGAEMDD